MRMNSRFSEFPGSTIRNIILVLAITVAGAALIRVGFFRPYRISGVSMANTLFSGDRILCNTWIFGWQTASFRLLGFAKPRPSQVLLFRRPLDKALSLRRCVAGPGQTVEIVGKELRVDGRPFRFPRGALASQAVLASPELASRDELPRLRLPQKGDTLDLAFIDGIEFDFIVALIRQENPDKAVRVQCRLLLNREDRSDLMLDGYTLAQDRFRALPFDRMTWLDFQRVRLFLEQKSPGDEIYFDRQIEIDGKPIMKYCVKHNSYFVMSDQWDYYDDSRLWGYLSSISILGRASLVYFSWGDEGPRLGRIGRIIR